MNCESKICVLENVQTVNSVYVISVRQKTVLACFCFFYNFFFFASWLLVVVILGWITSSFKSPLKLNMYTVCIK